MMSHARGSRIDDLGNGTFRLLYFGHFSSCIQSQEWIMTEEELKNLKQTMEKEPLGDKWKTFTLRFKDSEWKMNNKDFIEIYKKLEGIK